MFISMIMRDLMCMRVSEGVPRGRIAGLYNPEMFQEREEVIVLY